MVVSSAGDGRARAEWRADLVDLVAQRVFRADEQVLEQARIRSEVGNPAAHDEKMKKKE